MTKSKRAKTTRALAPIPKPVPDPDARRVLGRARGDQAVFPVPPPVAGLPPAYATTLREIKKRVSKARISAVRGGLSLRHPTPFGLRVARHPKTGDPGPTRNMEESSAELSAYLLLVIARRQSCVAVWLAVRVLRGEGAS